MSRRPPVYPALNAGRLTALVEFEQKTITVNANGQNVATWGAGFSDLCEVQRQSETSCRFILRYRNISPYAWPERYRAIYDGRIWTIDNAVPDIKSTMLIIDCSFASLIETTHLLSTKKEFIEGLVTTAQPE